MRPAKPVLSKPVPVIAPVNGGAPSRHSGKAGPPVSEVAVVVVDTLLTVIVLATSLSTRSVVPAGLENCSPVAPRAAVSWATTDAGPPVKLTPMTVTVGSGCTEFGNGRAVGS